MRITFKKNIISVEVNYKCDCGHNFKRKNSDWFTISPFNKKTPKEMEEEIKDTQEKKARVCPKCKSVCIPVSLPKNKTI